MIMFTGQNFFDFGIIIETFFQFELFHYYLVDYDLDFNIIDLFHFIFHFDCLLTLI